VNDTPVDISAVALVAAVLLRGLVVQSPEFSVGPCRLATGGDDVRFACLDWRAGAGGAVVEEFQCVDVLVEMTWGLDFEKTYEPDWSAFAAARAFVRLTGEVVSRAAAERALAA